MLYFYNIVTKPLLRHRVEQTAFQSFSVGTAQPERVAGAPLRGGSPCLLYGGLSF